MSPEGALTELFSSAGYYNTTQADIVPYEKDRVSWPESGSVPIPLERGLDKADIKHLTNWESYMLRDKEDYRQHVQNNHTHKPYCDPSLFASQETYSDCLERLHTAGMLRLRRASGKQGSLGIFLAREKDAVRASFLIPAH